MYMNEKVELMKAKMRRFNKHVEHQLLMLIVMMFASLPAWAGEEAFGGFRDAIIAFSQGPFAIGISVVALVLGAIGGLAKMSAWPALVGFAVAAVFAIGPYMIIQIFDIFGSENL